MEGTDSRHISFKTAERNVNALADAYKSRLMTATAATYPWELQVVRDQLNNMRRREQLKLSEAPLAGHMGRRMSSADLVAAMLHALALKRGWAALVRWYLTWAVPCARRCSDMSELR